jgi:hypothetical protein
MPRLLAQFLSFSEPIYYQEWAAIKRKEKWTLPPECCRQEMGSNHSFDLSVLFFSRTELLLSLSQRPWSLTVWTMTRHEVSCSLWEFVPLPDQS